jgi:transcription elongation factor GreA
VNNNDIFLTKEGLKNLKEEIKYLGEVKRKEIQEDISRALEYGDITENAEYTIAQEAQRMNEINIVRLKQKLFRRNWHWHNFKAEKIRFWRKS